MKNKITPEAGAKIRAKVKAFEMRSGQPRRTFDSGAVREERDGKGRFDLMSPIALFRLARVYEKGGRKYSPRNWEKGMPFSRFVDSAVRHIMQYLLGDRVEDHLAQASWNLNSLMHLEVTHPELNDLPKYDIDLSLYPELTAILKIDRVPDQGEEGPKKASRRAKGAK